MLRLEITGIMTIVVRLQHLIEEKNFILMLADFAFDALGDKLMTDMDK